mmetsp:Transcript_72878/g.152161  ORF Transcript_72878/g.152161 Transcript_72878/m.152161 type:complete len:773 (+) Transcript_72878:161-2479(+)
MTFSRAAGLVAVCGASWLTPSLGSSISSASHSLSVTSEQSLVSNSETATSVEGADANMNPIRRVVKMLQKMVETVEAEGKKEEELYDKFMCYCKTNGGDLAKSIAESTAKVPQIQHDIEESEAQTATLKSDLKSAQDDRAAAKTAMEAATAQREKEHKVFVETSTEYKGYLDALARAIPAIEKGMSGGALLQSQSMLTSQILKQAVVSTMGVTEYDRQLVTSFLAGSAVDSNGYIPKSGEISGILKTIEADFQKNLDEVTTAETEAVKLYEELMAAKQKQIDTLGASIEKKIQSIGELKVEVANMKADLTESEAALIADQKLASELESSCSTKESEWQERQKTRAAELVAIHDTIKILNDDDALDLFKKTLPSPSLIQVRNAGSQVRNHVRDVLKKLPSSLKNSRARPALDFLMLALSGKKVDFSKVLKMIDDMVTLLKQEQVDDDSKKEYCEKQIDSVEDKVKDLSKHIEDVQISIEESTEAMKVLETELAELAKGIKALDHSVQEETEMRKEEHQEYTLMMKENGEAKELLNFAKNRLNKYYNPALYKAPPKRNLTEQETIYKNFGGEVDETLPEASPALVEISSHTLRVSETPTAPPATWTGAYQNKTSETTGVIAMIDLLIKDLDTDMTEAEVEEKNAQKAYEELTADAASKRAADVKAISVKQTSLADFEESKVSAEGEHKVTARELQATQMFEMELHQECDWLSQNYDLRKSARTEEIESLHQAKAILSGADFTLLEVSSTSTALSSSGAAVDTHSVAPARRLRGA